MVTCFVEQTLVEQDLVDNDEVAEIFSVLLQHPGVEQDDVGQDGPALEVLQTEVLQLADELVVHQGIWNTD